MPSDDAILSAIRTAKALSTKPVERAPGGYVPAAALRFSRVAKAPFIPEAPSASAAQVLAGVANLGDQAANVKGIITGEEPAPISATASGSASAGASGANPVDTHGISPEAQAAYDALMSSWTGDAPTMISGYRDPKHNAEVGGAKGSQHIHGNAFDFDTSGWTPEQKLAYATAAYNAGFRGFGFYDNNLHVDVGGQRAWGPDYSHTSIPDWAQGWTNQYIYGNGYADGGEVVNLGEKREEKQLQDYHKSWLGDHRAVMNGMSEAYRKAADAGLFDGYEPGTRFLGKTGNGPVPFQITGHGMRPWKPSPLVMKTFERFNTKPTLIEHEGKQYVPIARTLTGNKDSGDWHESDAYLDVLKAANYPKMGGLKSAFATGGAVDPAKAARAALLIAKRATGGRIKNDNDIDLYSHAAEVASKLPQAKGTVEQFIAAMKKAGVKDTEIENAAPLPTGMITREELARHFASKQPLLRVERKGEEPRLPGYSVAHARRLDDLINRHNSAMIPWKPGWKNWRGDEVPEPPPKLTPEEHSEMEHLLRMRRLHGQRDLEDEVDEDGHVIATHEAQYPDYAAPGGTHYREHLLHLPKQPRDKSYQSSHWDRKNVVAHVRMQDMKDPRMNVHTIADKLAKFHGVPANTLGSGALDAPVKQGTISEPEARFYAKFAGWTGSPYYSAEGGPGRVLHVDEIQSDWAQDARKKTGNTETPESIAALRAKADESDNHIYKVFDRLRDQGLEPDEVRQHPDYRAALDVHQQNRQAQYAAEKKLRIPSAPYIGNTQNWVDLALKHVLNEAALGEYDRVQFASGKESADRYNLRTHFDSLHYDPVGKRLAGFFNRQPKLWKEGVEPSDLPEWVGADKAKQLLASPPAIHNRMADEVARHGGDPSPVHTIEGNDLSAGGEGMQAFYDNIIPKSAMKLIQKHDPDIKPDVQNGRFGFNLTPKARQSILAGQPAFASGGAVDDPAGNSAPKPQAAPAPTGGLPVGGGVSGGTGVASASYEAPLEGLPTAIKVPLTGQTITTGPSAHIRATAREYMQQAGLPYSPPTKYAKVDPSRAQRIAAAFDEMKDDPDHPLVQASYRQLAKEAMAQYHAAKARGFKAEFWNPETEEDPYHASPRLATEDVQKNNHMWVYPTHAGYGTNADGTPRGATPEEIRRNPMLADSGEVWNGQKVSINDIFRAIHDYYGHAKEGLGFRADGEENAWRSHAAMFSPLARLAMTTETRGQNSWLNYGPHGDKNRTARTEDTMLAPQKIGILPAWVHHEGAEDFISPQDRQKVVELTRGMTPSVAKALKLVGKRP